MIVQKKTFLVLQTMKELLKRKFGTIAVAFGAFVGVATMPSCGNKDKEEESVELKYLKTSQRDSIKRDLISSIKINYQKFIHLFRL